MRLVRRSLTGLTVAALTIAAAGAASAEGWRNRGNGNHGYGGDRQHRAEPAPRYGHYGEHHGGKKRDNTARNVILGISAVILGTILSEAARDSHRRYDYD